MNIIVLGPPGVGKGTQSLLLAKKFNLKHVSTGDLLRREMALETKLGLEISDNMNSGKYVSDEIVHELIQIEAQQNTGLVLDGFPRTLVQAQMLTSIFEETSRILHHVINLVADEDIIVRRILERGKTSGRGDDTKDVIQQRLETYYAETKILTNFYTTTTIDTSDSTIEQVFDLILQAINEK